MGSRSPRSSRRRQQKEESFEASPASVARRRPAKAFTLRPMTDAQISYDRSIDVNSVTFATGPAGTGKTWFAASKVACMLRDGEIEQIYITRPAVEADEELGFLPGEIEEKYAPYLAPVKSVLEEVLGAGQVEYMLKAGKIVPLPLAFMRGTTFKNAVVILDEAQNTTPRQMKMFLTRIGEGSKLIVNGDVSQKDIEGRSGLEDAIGRISHLPGVGVVRFHRHDIVRHDLCQAIVEAYEAGASLF